MIGRRMIFVLDDEEFVIRGLDKLLPRPDEPKLASAAIVRGIADRFVEKPRDEQLMKITLPMVMRIRQMAEAFRQFKEMVRTTHDENERTAVIHNELVSHGFEL